MARVRVTTPAPGYNGAVGAVHFANGEAFADSEVHAAEVAYFHARGYGVAEVSDAEVDADLVVDEQPEPEQPEPADQPAKNASTEAWRAWAVEHGGLSIEDAAAMTRDQLVERFARSEEDNA